MVDFKNYLSVLKLMKSTNVLAESIWLLPNQTQHLDTLNRSSTSSPFCPKTVLVEELGGGYSILCHRIICDLANVRIRPNLRHCPLVRRRELMNTLTPTSAPSRRKLDNSMKRNFNVHALLDGGISKICNQYLKYADMAHNKSRNHLLLHVDNDRVQAFDQIAK
jgi:hypothetical protein